MRIETESRYKLKEIMDIILDLQELGAHAFFYIYGHVDTIKVMVYKRGWNINDKRDYMDEWYLSSGNKYSDEDEDIDDCIKYLKKIRKDLKNKKRVIKEYLTTQG